MKNLSIRKMNELSKKKKKGFTLVELIIVIAIIAVLAAIAIPKFGQIKTDANLRSDQANAKIIATAVAMAISDGDSTTDAIKDTEYLKYVDGGKIAAPKSAKATAFTVTYDADKGTEVAIDGTYSQTVYPVD